MIVGCSRSTDELKAKIAEVGPTSVNVIITGESGVGKEVVAAAIHRHSARGKFVPVNCAAIPDLLFESIMFGHCSGSFTGAVRDHSGLLMEANGGTLFLDEVADLSLQAQAKLLRALEDGEILPVGAVRSQHVQFRLLSATHKEMRREIASGHLREDLYWRLYGVVLPISPLRERPEDIVALATHFAQDRLLSADALELLSAHSWPGNVRELRAVVCSAVSLTPEGPITAEQIAVHIPAMNSRGSELACGPTDLLSLSHMERTHILKVMRHVKGNRRRAAELLQIDAKTLRRRLVSYGDLIED